MSEFNDVLEHFGIRGMKWGIRRDNPSRLPPSEDAVNAKVSALKVKTSGTDALSTPELQQLINRLNLEGQYSRLSASKQSAGKKFVSDILGDISKKQVKKVANDYIGMKIEDSYRTKGKHRSDNPKHLR